MASGYQIIDLNPHYGLISVSGPDAETFLQGQLTADIREITASKPGFSAYCNPKGRIRALFRIFIHHESYFLQLPIGVLPSALAELKKVARFSKVKLEDVSDQWQRIGVWLPATEAVANILETNHLLDKIILLPLPSIDSIKRFELIGQQSTIQPVWEYLSSISEIRNFNAWKLLDIKACIPEIWPETMEQFLPHTLNLPVLGAVSFTKGCYCGQEIIARMEYRANIKHRLFNVTLSNNLTNTNTTLLPGSNIYSENNPEEVIGTVVTASQTEILGVMAR